MRGARGLVLLALWCRVLGRLTAACRNRWGVAKRLRRGTLNPVLEGSNPSAPTIREASDGATQLEDRRGIDRADPQWRAEDLLWECPPGAC